ncbi:thioredoxin family protein [Terracidiphilus gabretensis]|uniref:thioredoxin family protein n=1 Tax=Terracidiphilus gabretensis TaxID=1577687 RepID=UPI00071B0369|nr:thioredoxin family protein [Terracidiphilus gabretensis]
MYGLFFLETPKKRFSFAALFSLAFALSLNAQATAPQPSSADADHLPPVSAKISSLAHRLLAAGLNANALGGDGLKPWHIKIDYTMQPGTTGSPKPVAGTVEEWHTGLYQWRRDFTGSMAGANGSEWSVSKLERYETKNEQHYLGRRLITLRVARPVIDPLYQSVNIQPDYLMDASRVKLDPLVLTCISVVNAHQYVEETDPDWLFPTMCFDSDMHLRIVNSGDTAVQFDDIQPFQNRSVAHHVKVTERGATIAEMKVTLLEPWDGGATSDLMKPTQDAVLEPFKREPGMLMPVSTYEVAAHIPITAGQIEAHGSVAVRIFIQKDGGVKVDTALTNFLSTDRRNLMDAVTNAVSQWKYKPYIVDGQPVETEYAVIYAIDGKPFVPSYNRPAPPTSSGPGDYSSVYDYKRDPAQDLEKAKADAAKARKRILVEVGGTWCSWCTLMDRFYAEHPAVRQQRDDNFVLLKVNMSAKNENATFLGQYPKIPGYPWIFILDADGKLVTSKNTDDLEGPANTYSDKRFSDFLTSAKGQ